MTEILLSRPVRLTEISPDGNAIEIVANADERAALADLNNLPRIDRLTADLLVRPFGRGGLTVTGKVEADISQNCVVTLDAFDSHMEEPVDVRFVPEGSAEALAHNDNDPPDMIRAGQVDLGAIVAEFFALGLDPYPRKPGASFAGHEELVEPEPSPFAGLKDALAPKGGLDDDG